jgi:hypothetical protein
MSIWYTLSPLDKVCGPLLGIYFPLWYVWTKKNLATLLTRTPAEDLNIRQEMRTLFSIYKN